MIRPSADSHPEALSTDERALVAATWAFRTRAERESSLRFRRLSQGLEAIGALPQVIDLARRGSREEHRHAQLCAAMCARYGGQVPTNPPHDHPAVSPGLNGRDALLYEVVAFCCIAETINAQLLVTILNTATDPRIIKTVRRLLKDEINHGRLGWAHLAAERQAGVGGFLPELLPKMLAGSVGPGLFEDSPELATPAAIQHGELPRATRQEIFISVLRDVLLPGFDALKVPTTAVRRWMSERFPNSSGASP